MKFDPWAVKDVDNYSKLFKEFGIERFKYGEKFPDNRYFRRGIVFGHRDFGKIAQAIENKKPYIMITGLMPSGKMHFGHKMVADQMIWYQNHGANIYLCCANLEACLMRDIDAEEGKKLGIEEYLTNYLALGLTSKNLNFWFQTDYDMHYHQFRDKLAKRVTLNELKAVYGDLGPEKILSSLTQAADIIHGQLPEFSGKMPTVVPVGADQDPHIRLTRDIASRLRQWHDIELPGATFHRFMEGMQGGKMSSSDPKSYIALTEDSASARKKVMSARTGGRESLEQQKKLGGRPEECSVYQFYHYHLIDDDKELEEVRKQCKSGSLLCGECKKKCADLVVNFLEEHQKKRQKAKKEVKRII